MGTAFVVLASDSGESFRKGFEVGQKIGAYRTDILLGLLALAVAVAVAVWLVRRR